MILNLVRDIRSKLLPAILAVLGLAAAAPAALITPGNFVVYRVGDGTAPAVASNAAAVDLLEYTPGGTLVQTISMPSSGAAAFTDTFNSTSDGILQVSSDGVYITYAGYRRDAGLSAPDAQSATTTNRVFARLNVATGVVDASTAATVPNQVRGVATDGTNNYWITDSSGSPRYLAYGGTGNGAVLTNSISSSVATRQVSVVDGKLYASITSATPGAGIYSFAPVLPTTGTGTTVTQMVSGNFQGFLLADLDAGVAGVDTLYAVDITNNLLNKYSLVSGAWTLNNTLAAGGMQNLGGYVVGGNVVLYGSQFGKVAGLMDSSGYNAANNGILADVPGVTAGANYNFKGIAVVLAVPEPSSIVLLAMTGLAFFARKR